MAVVITVDVHDILFYTMLIAVAVHQQLLCKRCHEAREKSLFCTEGSLLSVQPQINAQDRHSGRHHIAPKPEPYAD